MVPFEDGGLRSKHRRRGLTWLGFLLCMGSCSEPAALPNQAPTALPGGPYSGTVGVAVGMDGSASSDPDDNTPLSFAWSFGDGASTTGAKPSHAYAAAGTFTVKLTVTDAQGLAGAQSTTTATIAAAPPPPPPPPPPNQAPTARPGGPYTGTAGTAVAFDGSASSDPDNNTPLTYAWSFGDGASATGAKPSHGYAGAASYTVKLTVTDAKGLAGAQATTTATITAAPPPGDQVFVGAGDITSCSQTADAATAALLENIAGTVYTLGDNAYSDGTASQYQDCYDPTWGRQKSRTRPVPGNHDYHTSGASGYFGYFGFAAGDPSKGYYSYDLGAWHILALNSEVSMAAGSAQETWVRADLAAHPTQCALAYWHQPRFSSGTNHGSNAIFQPMWQALYDVGVDVVLAGHEHNYERFRPQTPAGVADDAHGIREFVVGTGGEGHYPLNNPRIANSEASDGNTFGVLKLTLSATSYAWQFVPVAGASFTDSGSAACH